MHRFKVSRFELFVMLIFLFPITTLFQGKIPFLNKVLFTLAIFILFFVVWSIRKVDSHSFVCALIAFTLWGIAMMNTRREALNVNFNMALYFIFLIIYMIIMKQNIELFWDILNNRKGYLLLLVSFYTFFLVISIFMPGSYYVAQGNGWGNERYFVSFSESPNRVGPASLFIMIILIYLVQQNYRKGLCILLAIPQLFVFSMGGSRTYGVLGFSAFLILYYYWIADRKKFYLTLLPILLLFIVIILNSAMIYKIEATFLQGADNRTVFLQRLTNTRSIFWVRQLKMFFDTSLIHQIVGNGINFTTYYYGLWAHNDFIEILCSYGYIGLIYYCILMVTTIKNFLKGAQVPFLIKGICFFIWLFNAFFNFFYCYFCSMLSYIVLLAVVKHTQYMIKAE